jgi:hypothetical protein
MVSSEQSGMIRSRTSRPLNRIKGEHMDINKSHLLAKILEMIDKQNDRMDKAGTISSEAKQKSDGHLEALYQVENLILNWGEDVKTIE